MGVDEVGVGGPSQCSPPTLALPRAARGEGTGAGSRSRVRPEQALQSLAGLAWVSAVLLACACASALKEPAPVGTIGAPAPVPAASIDATLAAAEADLARRPDRDAVARAREEFLAASRAGETRVEGLLGAMRASAWLVEHETGVGQRQALVTEAVQLGQWCQRRAPGNAECDYRLALAVGQQSRERPATAVDGLKVMVELLEKTAVAAPGLDGSGPDRVLALVLLRAPGWPAGPGDPEAGLDHARRAAGREPEHAPNQLALGEALRANGLTAEARAAYVRAKVLAAELFAVGDPDAAEWRAEAEKALASL